jgi:hypothetical protein
MTGAQSRGLVRLRFKTGLLLLLLVLAVAASATVYEFFYSYSTSTVRTPDVTVAAGTDASGSCTAYPCATVSISGASDTATVTLSLFKADTTYTPPPSSYYTNLVQVKDVNNVHSILGVTITSVSSTSGNDFGKVIVYYCTSQCTFDVSGNVNGGTSVGSFSITSTTGGTISGFPQGIAVSGTHYIELVAYAGSSATAGDTISFNVAVQWV